MQCLTGLPRPAAAQISPSTQSPSVWQRSLEHWLSWSKPPSPQATPAPTTCEKHAPLAQSAEEQHSLRGLSGVRQLVAGAGAETHSEGPSGVYFLQTWSFEQSMSELQPRSGANERVPAVPAIPPEPPGSTVVCSPPCAAPAPPGALFAVLSPPHAPQKSPSKQTLSNRITPRGARSVPPGVVHPEKKHRPERNLIFTAARQPPGEQHAVAPLDSQVGRVGGADCCLRE